MKILLIGGLGNLGSALINKFRLNEDLEIYVLDDPLRINPNMAGWFSRKNIKFLDSISNIINDEIINDLKIDIAVHLAFRNVPDTDLLDPGTNHDPNFALAKKVSNACVSSKIPLIYASSTSVYHGLTGLVTEETPVHRLSSSYARSKMDVEQLLKSSPQLTFAILRLGSVHGLSASMQFETVVNKFCLQYSHMKPLTVWYGALNVIRPYLSILDFVRAVEFIIYNLGFNNQVFNLVTKSWSTQEIVSILEKKGGFPPAIEYETKPGFSQESILVSTSKFEETGFKFTGSLEDDIKDTLSLLRGNH
jgi:nucleoside-diphosphate-sugar epimerase